ncbi:MAG: peptide deformylase [Myxococcales bacterium]|nr:peptide deformylase [Myxococcales bacterium]
MAILKVAQLGHPILRERSREVTREELAHPGFQQFCRDLLDTMEEYDGAGLAAPQVHALLRVVVLVIDDERGVEFLINPEIEVLADSTRRTWEGCLSVEGMRGLVERPDHIRLTALDLDGSEKVLEIEGHGAVVVQHECDHLDGVLYVDRVLPRSLMFVSEYRRWGPPAEYDPAAPEDGTDQLADEAEVH